MFRRRAESPRRSSPYESVLVEELILRDHLAVDRTALANERTLLSYERTALACLIGGASVLHFLSGFGTDLLGGASIALGVGTAVYGGYRYRWYKHRIEAVTAASTLASRIEPDSN